MVLRELPKDCNESSVQLYRLCIDANEGLYQGSLALQWIYMSLVNMELLLGSD